MERVATLTDRFDRALLYATLVHGGQVRKGTSTPYVAHLLAVSATVLDYGGDEDLAIAALLHDSVEDQGGKARLEDVRNRFGDRVARVVAACSDSLADTATRIGLKVQQSAYTLSGAAANSMIVTYNITPTDLPVDVYQVNAGLFMDWNLGDYGLRDSAWFDKSDSIFYIIRTEPGYAVVAMKMASTSPVNSPIRYYALNNSVNDGGVSIGNFLTASDKWSLFQTLKGSAGAGDVAVLLGANVNFKLGEASLTFIMALGDSVGDARKNVLTTLAVIRGMAGVSKSQNFGPSSLDIWPNPATERVRVMERRLPSGAPLAISISDLLGRTVLRTTIPNGSELDISQLPYGMLGLQVMEQGSSTIRTIVKQ